MEKVREEHNALGKLRDSLELAMQRTGATVEMQSDVNIGGIFYSFSKACANCRIISCARHTVDADDKSDHANNTSTVKLTAKICKQIRQWTRARAAIREEGRASELRLNEYKHERLVKERRTREAKERKIRREEQPQTVSTMARGYGRNCV